MTLKLLTLTFLLFSLPLHSTEPSELDKLNEAIANYTLLLEKQDVITPLDAVCLQKPKDEDPLDCVKAISKAYKPFDYNDPSKLHVPAWGELAYLLLKMIKKRVLPFKCVNKEEVESPKEEIQQYMAWADGSNKPNNIDDVKKNIAERYYIETLIKRIDNAEELKKREKFDPYFKVFKDEIDQRLSAQETTYRWLMLFSDELSVLTSQLLYRSFSDSNTLYPLYFYYADHQEAYPFPDFSEDKYKLHVDEGIVMMQQFQNDSVMSLPGLLNQFPTVMMMP